MSRGRQQGQGLGTVRGTGTSVKSSVPEKGEVSIIPSSSVMSDFVSTRSVQTAGDAGSRTAGTGDPPGACKPQEN